MKKICILAALSFFIAVELKAETCFCKVLCFWNGEDSSDFYKVLDVSCDKSVEMQQEFANTWLMRHVEENHPGFAASELKSKTEITCYQSKTGQNVTPKKNNKK